MGWRTLYIEESDNLSLYLDNIKVVRGVNELFFPLSDISIMLIDNTKTQLTIKLINACSSNNIPIISCGDDHHPIAILLPFFGHFESAKIQNEQLQWTKEMKDIVWQDVIKAKISKQLFVLKRNTPKSETIEYLTSYVNSVQVGDNTNREGLAAKAYFRSLFGDDFTRNDENVINASLNYGYSVMRAIIAKVVVSKGLNPLFGIFHKGMTNSFNLVDDILELYRSIVDDYVYNNFMNEKIFKREHRLKILTLINGKVEIQQQKQTLIHSVEIIVDDLITYFRKGEMCPNIFFEPILYDL